MKVTVNLPEETVQALRQLADQEGKTFTQSMKEAISLKLFVTDLIDEGSKLLVERPDKSIREVWFQ